VRWPRVVGVAAVVAAIGFVVGVVTAPARAGGEAAHAKRERECRDAESKDGVAARAAPRPRAVVPELDPASDRYDAPTAGRVLGLSIGGEWAREPAQEPFRSEREGFVREQLRAGFAEFLPAVPVEDVDVECRRATCKLTLKVPLAERARAEALLGALGLADARELSWERREANAEVEMWLEYTREHVDGASFRAFHEERLRTWRPVIPQVIEKRAGQ
jgi:hypothetical protein